MLIRLPWEAAAAAGMQQQYFKEVDAYKLDDCQDSIASTTAGAPQRPPRSRASVWEVALAGAIQSLPPIVPSRTVVMEAAFHLLVDEGLLNVDELGRINVKQARALLWNVAWLQEHMSVRWRSEGRLQTDLPGDGSRHFTDFGLAIMGPGGTGKTAVLKVIEALTVFSWERRQFAKWLLPMRLLVFWAATPCMLCASCHMVR